MDREILVTYRDLDHWTFDWLEDEEEAKEWILNNEGKGYTDINIIRTRCIDKIYPKE